MTRNNLDSHISWLLSSEVTPPVGVQVRASTNSATVIESGNICLLEENLEEEDSRAALIPIQNRPTSQTVDARFVRPPIPPSIAPKTQQRESSQTSGNESMGKLASAQRSTRPGLMSQHQLATPTPTTTSTAAPSSLRQGYANLLRENSG
jgi:bloom syndrome protein